MVKHLFAVTAVLVAATAACRSSWVYAREGSIASSTTRGAPICWAEGTATVAR
jgi:hypothetical protein